MSAVLQWPRGVSKALLLVTFLKHTKQTYSLLVCSWKLQKQNVWGVNKKTKETGAPGFENDPKRWTLTKKPTKIILKFNGREKFNIINSKPPHHSWTIKENQDGLFATMYLQHNNELENLILQLIPEVEVIHPKKLRKSIFEKLSISKNSHTN